MARYIDAVKSADIISERLNIPLGDLVDIFADIPTADVVEVVRCKDCKHCWHLVPDYTYPDRTDDVWECVRTIDYVEPDHFCRRGERRTE